MHDSEEIFAYQIVPETDEILAFKETFGDVVTVLNHREYARARLIQTIERVELLS